MRLALVAVLAAFAAAPAFAQSVPAEPGSLPPGVTPGVIVPAPPGMQQNAAAAEAAAEAKVATLPADASQASETAAAAGGTPAVEPEAQQESAEAATGNAPAAGVAEPATPPSSQQAAGSVNGTEPAAAGSTGWTGGTGGSMIGTNPSGAVGVSKSWQPPTARGIDLMMGAAEPA